MGMRERVQALGGDFKLESSPGAGLTGHRFDSGG
jgi:signal transduction histidine kinase